MKFLSRPLVAVYDAMVFYAGLAFFGLMCLVGSLLLTLMRPFLSRNAGRALGRFAIKTVFRTFLASLKLSGRFRFDLGELDSLRNEKSLIIAPNHPSLWDAVLLVSRLQDVACIMKGEIITNIFLGSGAHLAGYIRNESPRQMITLGIEELQRGGTLLFFPEGTRTVNIPINPFRAGIGVIANRARAPVQTVFIETDSPFLTKGWPVYKMPRLPVTYRVRLGRRFDPPTNSADLTAELEKYFRSEMGSPDDLTAEAGSTP